jgi:hypothetical protein
MAEVVLDANVLVGLLYADDVHHERARDLVERLETDGHFVVLIDVLVYEALSVLCRRARERKTSPPDLVKVLTVVRSWFDDAAYIGRSKTPSPGAAGGGGKASREGGDGRIWARFRDGQARLGAGSECLLPNEGPSIHELSAT